MTFISEKYNEKLFFLDKIIGSKVLKIIFGILTMITMIINEVRFLFTDSRSDKVIYPILVFLVIARIIEIILYNISKKIYNYTLLTFDIIALITLIAHLITFHSIDYSNINVSEENFDSLYIFSQIRGFGEEFQIHLISSVIQCIRFIMIFANTDLYLKISKYVEKEDQYIDINQSEYETSMKEIDENTNENNMNSNSLTQLLNYRLFVIIIICVLLYPLLSCSVWIKINSSAFSQIKNLTQLSMLRNQYPGDETWPNAYMLELSYFVFENSIGDSSNWMRLIAIQAPFTLNNNPTCEGCPKSNLEVITNAMSIITNSKFPSWFVEVLTLPALTEGISLIPTDNFNSIRRQSLRQYSSYICMRSGVEAFSNSSNICPDNLKEKITAVFDMSATIQFGAGLTIGITMLTLMMLSMFVFVFQGLLEKHIFSITRRINGTLMKIARNPLLALEMSQNTKKTNNSIKKNSNNMLEETFSKLGALLAVGLGSAGANIIVQNLKDNKIVVKLPGKKVFGIFGFCDIRNFTDITEILGEDVMPFVNQIAEISHSIVCKYGGIANKNVGDAFLFVWKDDNRWDGIKTLLADLAVLSFITIIKEISHCPRLKSISLRSDIQARIPNYGLKLGFGLHYGWAIEGAIGSEYKIDASYLSPNVNLSSRLEEATKHYGVYILFSGSVFNMLSLNMKHFCRKIDCVTLKGSKTPIDLYTIDINPELNKSTVSITRDISEKNQNAINERVFSKLFTDGNIKNMRGHIFNGFNRRFNQGLKHYLVGNWQFSRHILDKLQQDCRKKWGEVDGPTQTILKFMEKNNFIKPDNWNGYRVWEEK
ncbi:membrane associated adenylyl cyclase with 6 transmembrane regions and an adenylyl cyclase domain [Cryptosporidium ryanae]|uniref:membrane associated adenylyl cyclase with 6 transmembrane regions and an adenylyl cyclase domain n=1 Tax=Cryptosporidium ryanae TaxID=515981 RepID=UPI00351A1362|nr:membrane associated adenylyl cyclase with 6 transmembrane regions and an adenylyl cyclase domain [Cryptosporidium ryanae]